MPSSAPAIRTRLPSPRLDLSTTLSMRTIYTANTGSSRSDWVGRWARGTDWSLFVAIRTLPQPSPYLLPGFQVDVVEHVSRFRTPVIQARIDHVIETKKAIPVYRGSVTSKALAASKALTDDDSMVQQVADSPIVALNPMRPSGLIEARCLELPVAGIVLALYDGKALDSAGRTLGEFLCVRYMRPRSLLLGRADLQLGEAVRLT